MAVPFGLGKILDIIYASNSATESGVAREKLDQFCLILAVIFILGGLANFGRVYLFNNACKDTIWFNLIHLNTKRIFLIALRITKKLRGTLYSRIMTQECGWFDTKGTGELVNRISLDTSMIGNSLSQNLSDGLRSVAMVIAGTSMMVKSHV